MISRPSSDHLKLAQLPPDQDSVAHLADSFLLDAAEQVANQILKLASPIS
ncbi:MAG: hypothetical protein ACRBM6_00610 [Geminicoccales bacterium]